MILKISIVIIFIISLESFSCAKSCREKLGELANSQSKFVSLATHNAVPVNFCKSCKDEFSNMTNFYEKLEADCSKDYFDNDRVNIISSMQAILVGLWKKAFCDDCFEGNKLDDFVKKNTTLNNCLKQNPHEPCVSCLTSYDDLNKFYDEMDVHNNGKVCFDIQDMMNRTRSTWSKDLKCCKRDYSMFFFTLAASFVMALPVVFYTGFFAYSKHVERNHEIMAVDNENPSTNEILVEPSTSNTTVASTSSALHITHLDNENRDNFISKPNGDDSDRERAESSDEELLLKKQEQPSSPPLIKLD